MIKFLSLLGGRAWVCLVLLALLVFLCAEIQAATNHYWDVTFDNAEGVGNTLITGHVLVESENATSAINKCNSDLKKQFGKNTYNATAAEKVGGIDPYVLHGFVFNLPSGTIIVYGVQGETQPTPVAFDPSKAIKTVTK